MNSRVSDQSDQKSPMRSPGFEREQQFVIFRLELYSFTSLSRPSSI
ncbi:MAG TPA: hypothetical protein V6D27_07680 [Vampirovibrionales bacterium]